MTGNLKERYIDAPWLLSEKACVNALESIVERDVHDDLAPLSSDAVILKKYLTRRSRILAQIEGAYELAASIWSGTLNQRADWFLAVAREKRKQAGLEEATDEALMKGFSYHASDDIWMDENSVRYEDLAFNYERGFWSLVLKRMGVRGFMNKHEAKAKTPETRAAADRWLLDFAEDKPGVRDTFIREVRAAQCDHHGWTEEEEDAS